MSARGLESMEPGGRAEASLPPGSFALVTGGAGFIGSNLADALLSQGTRVRVFDDLSRRSVRRNLEWLRARHPESIDVRIADVRDAEAVRSALHGISHVFHLAAQ